MRRSSSVNGFTLLEIIVTIVVVAIAATALMGVFTNLVARSADPVIIEQATAIAEAYMEEIRLKPFQDPDGGETGSSEATETRASFDDVQDYNGTVNGTIRDQNGNAIGDLSDYSITVTVTAAAIGPGPASTTVQSTDSRRIDIAVDHPAIDPIRISSFRTNHY